MTMRVWTLGPLTDRPFDGESSLEKGGRWHRPGTRLAYSSESLPLAVLEFLVHLDDGPPRDLHCYALDVPVGWLEWLRPDELPTGWNALRAPDALCDITARWLVERTSPALCVPSAVVEECWNVLLNPEHPSWQRPLRPTASRPFRIDPRLLGGTRGSP
jgi:RES domain-containing protein